MSLLSRLSKLPQFLLYGPDVELATVEIGVARHVEQYIELFLYTKRCCLVACVDSSVVHENKELVILVVWVLVEVLNQSLQELAKNIAVCAALADFKF